MTAAIDLASTPSCMDAALGYASRGWSVIPLRPRDKRPALKEWKEFQTRRANESEIRAWWTQWPKSNVGIVTGAVSGLVVLDIDGEEGARSLATLPEANTLQTPVVTTGKGSHAYFKHPGRLVPNFARKMPGLDLRGDGGYVVAPPSIHPSGGTYSFCARLGADTPLAAPPPALLAIIQADGAKQSAAPLDFSHAPAQRSGEPVKGNRYVESAIERELGRVAAAEEGTRNATLNEAAFSLGQLVGGAVAEEAAVERRLLMTAMRSGLPEPEARRTIESGMTAGRAQPRGVPEQGGAPIKRADNVVAFTTAATARAEVPQSGVPAAIDISTYRLDLLTVGAPPQRQWLVRGAVPLAVPVVIFGPGGVGKSMAVLDLCLKVATRHQAGPIVDPLTFVGAVPPEAAGAAIFVTLEDDTAELHRRTAALDVAGRRADSPLYVFPGLDMPGFDPTLIRQEGRTAALTHFAKGGLDALIDAVTEESGAPVRLIAFDPAGDLLDGSEDDAAVVKPLMRRLREIAARRRSTVMLVGHSAKGQLDGDTVAARGMRGSGAWIANARAAFGLWRPEADDAVRTLKRLEMEETAANIDRVVFGRMVKSNAPGSLTGVRRFLQDPSNGLLLDVTDGLRNKARDDAEVAASLLLATIKEAAELEMPFQIDGKSGLYARRSDLPEPLNGWGQRSLRQLGNSLVENGSVVKCKLSGRGAPLFLDVPGGGYSTGMANQIASGSLAEARRARASRVAQ